MPSCSPVHILTLILTFLFILESLTQIKEWRSQFCGDLGYQTLGYFLVKSIRIAKINISGIVSQLFGFTYLDGGHSGDFVHAGCIEANYLENYAACVCVEIYRTGVPFYLDLPCPYSGVLGGKDLLCNGVADLLHPVCVCDQYPDLSRDLQNIFRAESDCTFLVWTNIVISSSE